jgi:hypothetical protein
MMTKEAVVDHRLACPCVVVRGAGSHPRKAIGPDGRKKPGMTAGLPSHRGVMSPRGPDEATAGIRQARTRTPEGRRDVIDPYVCYKAYVPRHGQIDEQAIVAAVERLLIADRLPGPLRSRRVFDTRMGERNACLVLFHPLFLL